MNLPDGTILSSPELIHNGTIDYFKNFLEARISLGVPNLFDLLSKVILERDNLALCSVPSVQEIHDAICSIPVDSNPGPDGFESGFYKAYWSIVKDDVEDAVAEFFSGAPLLRFYSTSFLVLISKIPNPESFDKFRPISLCSVFYKICSKILVNQLSPSLVYLTGTMCFIKGRSIFENISLTQEMIHGLNKQSQGRNVVLKVDMAKASDSSNWAFLIHVLSSFGFSDHFYALIRQCISTPWYFVVMNGILKGFFQDGRGLRQSDPLSFYLFIIMEEVLSRMLKKQWLWERFRHFIILEACRLFFIFSMQTI